VLGRLFCADDYPLDLNQMFALQWDYTPQIREDEKSLTGRLIELAAVYGRYGTPRITAMLRDEGWAVNHKRVERIWHEAGLKVPKKQPKRGRLWLNNATNCSQLNATLFRCQSWQDTVLETQTKRLAIRIFTEISRILIWRSLTVDPLDGWVRGDKVEPTKPFVRGCA
jgi:transposase InsO family protein